MNKIVKLTKSFDYRHNGKCQCLDVTVQYDLTFGLVEQVYSIVAYEMAYKKDGIMSFEITNSKSIDLTEAFLTWGLEEQFKDAVYWDELAGQYEEAEESRKNF